jgi:hypothetical protein
MFALPINTRSLGRSAILLVAALVLLFLTRPAEAAPAKPKREPQHGSNAQLREAIHVLQLTKKTLEGADHDYGGHRVDAVKAIGAAEHQLKLALGAHHKGKKAGAKGGKGGKGNEPQNISNMQLADAIPILQRTVGLMEKGNHDYGGHREQAIKDVNIAIHQLKLALEFEKKREK